MKRVLLSFTEVFSLKGALWAVRRKVCRHDYVILEEYEPIVTASFPSFMGGETLTREMGIIPRKVTCRKCRHVEMIGTPFSHVHPGNEEDS